MGACYEEVEPEADLMQGDLILACPVIRWNPDVDLRIEHGDDLEKLETGLQVEAADVVVLTQACDLEQRKVDNVVLCPAYALSEYRPAWEEAERARRRSKDPKADLTIAKGTWNSHFNDIRADRIANLSLLASFEGAAAATEIRVVDFSEVLTVPRSVLESLLARRGEKRLRLLSDPRHHLSQRFGNFFQRVGLPFRIEQP